ncbi:MAG TPA: hypothetical protein VFI64_07535 [Nitrososphaeraceae archaeon]|nr:hypothetical protein [Nitrososphaeraceae archaeon]
MGTIGTSAAITIKGGISKQIQNTKLGDNIKEMVLLRILFDR